LRIAQIELEFSSQAPARGKVVQNDLITDKLTALYRKLNAISTGDAVVGTSESTPGGAGEDTIPPAAPTGLTVASIDAYQAPGESETYSLVVAGWNPVTTNAYADTETSGAVKAAELIADRLRGKSSIEQSDSGKAEAARQIGDRIESNQPIFEDWTWSGAPAVVGQYNDVLLAEFESDRPKAHAADLIRGRLESGKPIFEDWTWAGAPAVVRKYNDELGDEFAQAHPGASPFSSTAISSLQGYVRSNTLAWLDQVGGSSGSAIFEDWTWSGMPAVVETYHEALLKEAEEAGISRDDSGATIDNWPFSAAALAWLDDYPATHAGGGAITDDVANYRVQWRFLGSQVVPSRQDPGNGVPGEPQPPRDPNAFPDDAAWFEPGESPTTTNRIEFGGVLAGRAINVRVSAVDRSGNQGPWCTPVAIVTAIDNRPPPVPSKPIAVAWFRTMDITWDGKGSSGEDMFAAAPDVAGGGGIEVHVDTAIDFTPDRPIGANGKVDVSASRTYRDYLPVAMTTNVVDLKIGTTYYARFVAVDRTGNASEPSETSDGVLPERLVNIDIGPDAIAREQIIDAEIVRAKIADLAVNDAKIEDLNVGKIRTGTLTATVVLGGRIETPLTNGNQIQIDNGGIRLYRGGSVIGRWEVFDGSMLITGQMQTAVTGQRIVENPGGGSPHTMRFYPTFTDVYSSITSVDFQGGTIAGIQIVGSGTTEVANRGMLIIRDQNASLVHGRTDLSYWGSEIWVEQNFTRNKSATVDLIVDERLASLSGPRRVAMITYDSSGFPRNATGLYYGTTGAFGGEPMLYANGQDVNLVFGGTDGITSSRLLVRNNANTQFRDIAAGAFAVSSSQEVKYGIREFDGDPVQHLRASTPKHFRRHGDLESDAERLGFIAEEMPDEVRRSIRRVPTDGDEPEVIETVDLGAISALLWAAVQRIDKRVSELEDVPLPPPSPRPKHRRVEKEPDV
jgi:hypothetical protein